MSLFDSFIGIFSAKAALSRALDRQSFASLKKMKSATNHYDATGNGHRGFKVNGDASAKSVASASLVVARKNASDLLRNNPIYEAAIDTKVQNTIGEGIRPSLRTKGKSKQQKKRLADIQERIDLWANSVHSDVYGMHNLFGSQFLAWQTTCVRGEALIVRQRTLEPASGINLQMKMLEGDYLDHTKNGTNESNSNNIINGVEFNDSDQPVGYWLFDQHPGDVGFFKKLSFKSRRHDAANVIHLFNCKRPGEIRGLPEGLSAFPKIKNLEEFQDARLELMKVAACLVGSVTTTGSGIGNGANAVAGDPLPSRMNPGLLLRLNQNEKLEFNQPPNVSGQDSFVSQELHHIAAVFGITYEAHTGDYSQVNFTSGRMGKLKMDQKCAGDRNRIIIPIMLNKVWGWLQEALDLEGKPLRNTTCQWIPPRAVLFDPTKEIPPLIKAIRAGLKPMQRALLEQGDNPEHILEQYNEWNEWLDKQQLVLDTDPRRVSGAGNTNPLPEKEDDDENEIKPGTSDGDE